MKNFLGNTSSVINWQTVVDSLGEGKIKKYGNSDHIDINLGFNKIFDMWDKAGYFNINTIEWFNFYPNNDFNLEIELEFGKFVKKIPVRSWISKIYPGKCAPMHIDVDDKINEYKNMLGLTRYTCHISTPEIGHIFILEDDVFYNEEKGNTYQWSDTNMWHGGGNVGWKPKYLYNFLGQD
jgi:hypothetical protein